MERKVKKQASKPAPVPSDSIACSPQKNNAEPSFSRCARLFSFFHPIAISKNIRILTPAFPALKKGTWTVLDFWATWCPDCRREIPTVKEMYKKYGTCAKFIGVSMDTDKQKLDNYTQANGVEWEQYSEFKKWKETQISKDYKISWLPTMYLINPEGKVVYTTVLAERMAKKLAEIFPEK